MINIESLELHISDFCNLSCRGCSHMTPLDTKTFINIEETVDSLNILKQFLHCKVIRLLGGEPTLNPNLEEIVIKIKKVNIADTISIATNGLLLDKLTDNILKNIDVLEISNYNYSQAKTEALIEWCKNKKIQHNIKSYIYMYKYFREPFTMNEIDDSKLVNDIYQNCIISNKWQCFNLYNHYLFKCPESVALCKYIDKIDEKSNGVHIYDSPKLKNELINYITSDVPLPACKYCLGSVGKRFKIEQTTKKNYKEQMCKELDRLVDTTFLERCKKSNISDMYTVEKVIEV